MAEPGRCKAHDEAAEGRAATAKSAFLELFADGSNAIKTAAAKTGVGVVTIWRWRQQDPEFDRAMKAAQIEADAVRVALVEDSLFSRIVSGKASAAETIFFLVNRGRERWGHTQRFEHAHRGEITTPIREMSDEELTRHVRQLASRLTQYVGDIGSGAPPLSRVKDDRS